MGYVCVMYMHVCGVWLCVHVSACVCVYMWAHMHVKTRRQPQLPLQAPTNLVTVCLSRQNLLLARRSSFDWLGQLASELQRSTPPHPTFSHWSWRSDAHAFTASTSLSKASFQPMSADHYVSKTPQHSDSLKHHFNKAEKPFKAGIIDSNVGPFIILSNHPEVGILGYLLDSGFVSFTEPQEPLESSGGLFALA